MKLTENFALEEFSKEKLTEYQIGLLQMLATQLQKLRDGLQEERIDPKKPVTIGISSGVRTMADYERLKKKGYHPSRTSDHFCGLQLDGRPCLVDGVFTEEWLEIEKYKLREEIEGEINDKRSYCIKSARRKFFGDFY